MTESPPENMDEGKDRPFICPCGKTYLSYPALFTHIKQKHNGVPPGDIIRPKATNKRGRPRKNLVDPNNDGNSPLENKSALERYYLGKDDGDNFLQLRREAQEMKKQYKTSIDFVPPISFSHSPHRPPLTKESPIIKTEQKPDVKHPALQLKIKNIFQQINSSSGYLNEKSLQQLIAGNREYQRAKMQERCKSRRPIGLDRWQMQLRTGFLQWLDWCQAVLSHWQFKNVELLVSLLIFFYYQMLPEGRRFTTANYITYLNYFSRQIFSQKPKLGSYRFVYSFQRTIMLQLLSIMQEWFVLEELSHYDATVNPYFSDSEGKGRSSAQFQSEGDQS